MPFGKFKGLSVDDLPERYLEWLWAEVDLREPLKSAVLEAMGMQTRSLSPMPESDEIRSIYRRLCRKYHPDAGGTHEAMTAVNEFYEEIRSLT